MSHALAESAATVLRFAPPAPGFWELDRSHYPSGTTRISQELMEEAMVAGMRRVFAEIGTPTDALAARFVNGFMYTRLRPLIRPDKPSAKLPPSFVLAFATRVHPAFRARTRAATRAFDNKIWRGVVEQWHQQLRPNLIARNNEFAAVDVLAIGDAELESHIAALIRHCRSTFELHFWLHGYDLGPIAEYLHEARGHGITGSEAVAALAGASPATRAPLERLAAIQAALGPAAGSIRALDDVRAHSQGAASALDAYLHEYGDSLATGYDLDGRTFAELPELLLSAIRTLAPAHDVHGEASAAAAHLRARVPEPQRARFDDVLEQARFVMDLRDDNGPNTVERPLGLLRKAMLEAGRRLVAAGRADSADHVFELAAPEITGILSGTAQCSPLDLRERAATRAADARLDPPLSLGAPEPRPPISVLPPVLRRLVGIVETALTEMGLTRPEPGSTTGPGTAVAEIDLRGTGVGTIPYRGRARCAENADDAVARLEPGDVLVVRATTPAFNAVLAIAGAVVTADGGPLSHASVLARELGIAAVVGAPGAMAIPDGAIVEVDPVQGLVRLL